VNHWLTDHGFLVIREGNNIIPILKSPDFLGSNSLNPSDYRLNASSSSSRRASGASGGSGSPLSPGDRLHDFPSSPLDDDPNGEGKTVLLYS
jgi:hypothetical protein